MKNIGFAVISIILMMSSSLIAGIPGKTTLSGKIIDKISGLPLPGVNIYLPELKTGTVSNIDGTYFIDQLPQAKVLVQVSFIGYKLIEVTIDLSAIIIKDFEMEESVAELHEIVITGLSRSTQKNRTPAPISTVPQSLLLENASTNIIDALAKQPGVSQITTGPGISKPVIRGLGYNRVVTMNDGIRQEGQQWGDEHGIEIDEFAINSVEILKGPASLAYGSDAMAGVINMLSAPTLPDGKITGNLLTNYQTNNGLLSYSGSIAGNKNGFIWDLRYSNKRAHAYQNKYDGFVYNSNFKQNTFSGIIGLNKSWGYSHLHFSNFNLTPGLVEGERDSLTGFFVKAVALNDSTETIEIAQHDDFISYAPAVPFQKIHHSKAALNNSFILGEGSLKSTLGFQQNQRLEYADVLDPNNYELYFLLNTFTYDVRYLFADKNNFNLSFGVNGMDQSSQNKGTEFLIPEYSLFDLGVYAMTQKTMDQWDISAGLRFDSRNEKGEDLYLDAEGNIVDGNDPEAFHQFVAFNSTYSGVSGSIGAAYQFSEKVFTKLNLSRGFRAPNIAEISANGVHEGTINFIIGVPTLKPENSLQLDYAIGLNSDHITAELDLFSNSINNFIFLSKLESVFGGDSLSNGYSTFKYLSGDANISGGEFSIDIHPHPLDWLHFENMFSYVLSTQKNQPDSAKYLPNTPAPKMSNELKATAKKVGKYFRNGYVMVELENYFIQDKFYSAFGTETATPAYTLLNVGIGMDIISKQSTFCSIYINANNLTDVAYQSHLSRLKYAPLNNATGRRGVYNMGRNISFKLLMPLQFSK